jgi:hypothetical protein
VNPFSLVSQSKNLLSYFFWLVPSINSKNINKTMKCSASVLALLATGATAFTPSSNKATSASSELKYSEYWTPDESAFACGLPGSLAPVGEFDPLGFAKDADEQKMKNYREAELQHGRVASKSIVNTCV